MDGQDSVMSELQNRSNEMNQMSDASGLDPGKDYSDMMPFDDGNYDDEDGNNFRGNNRGRGNFRSVSVLKSLKAMAAA